MREINNGFIVSKWNDKTAQDDQIYAKTEAEAGRIMLRMMVGKA